MHLSRRAAPSLATLIVVACTSARPAGSPRLATPPLDRAHYPGLWDDDWRRLDEAHAHGVRVDGARVVAWFPADAPAPAARTHVVAMLDRGVAALDRMIGAQPWWRVSPPRPVTFVFAPGAFVAHAPGAGLVFIPASRMADDDAPWLHEAAHALLASTAGDWLNTVPEAEADRAMPLWFTEGLADYLSQRVAEAEGLRWPSLFDDLPLGQVDAECAARTADAPGATVLGWIGVAGRPDPLFGPDRFAHARVFYPCAKAFVAHLVTRLGLPAVVHAAGAIGAEQATLERALGASLADQRARWVAAWPR